MSTETSGATPTTDVTPTATVTLPATTATPSQGATPTTTPATTPDTAAQLRELQGQVESANARIRELNRENKDHRLRADSIQSATDEEKSLAAFIKENGGLDAIKERIERESTLMAEKQTREKHDSLREVATGLGLKANSLFLRMADGLEFVPVKDGDKVTGYNVKQGDSAVPFTDFAQSNEEWRDALPALQVKPEPQGTPWPVQPSGKGIAVNRDPVQEYLSKTYSPPSRGAA
jgi:hypothetical protein